MTRGEKEMAALVTEWSNKIAKITERYEKAIGTLKQAKDNYDNSWSQILLKFLPYILPFLILIAVVISLYILGCHTTIKFEEIEITRNCTK